MKSRATLWLFPVFILFFFLPPTGGSSQSTGHEICLQILARYNIKSFTLTLREGSIFSQGRSVITGKIPVTLSLEKKRIMVRKKKVCLLRGRDLIISSHNPMMIEFIHKHKKFRRFYQGKLQVYRKKNCLLLVNITPLEIYVQAASQAELGPVLAIKDRACSQGWRRELTQAMEIVIRSYLLHMKNRHTDPRYNFCDLTHCIHFPGVGERLSGSQPSSGRGRVILDETGRPHGAFFHASSGGLLSGPEIFWPRHRGGKHYRRGTDSLPELKKYLSWRSPHESWETRLKVRDIEKIFRTRKLASIKVCYRQKRAASLELKTTQKVHTVSAARFMSLVGKRLGWNKIKSNLFTVTRKGAFFVFKGRGLGHGIGLSQWSAGDLACRGWTSEEIISYFYNNPELSEWPR